MIKNFRWALALVGVILGMMLSLQYRVTRDIQQNEAIRKTQDLTNQLVQLKKERDALQTQSSRMRAQLDRLSTGPFAPQLKEEMRRAEILAGVSELTGAGVEVTVKDSNISLKPGDNPNLFVVHDEDILKVVNELRAAGAEAISINSQRLIATSEIECSGPVIRVNKKPLAPPFIIAAIGDPETMESSLKIKGGVVEILKFYGIQVSVKKLPQVVIPSYSGGIKYNYAKMDG